MLISLQVEVMQKELQELQPVLAATAKEVEDMMVVITNDKKEADETKKQVEEQEKEANEQVRLLAAAFALHTGPSYTRPARLADPSFPTCHIYFPGQLNLPSSSLSSCRPPALSRLRRTRSATWTRRCPR